MMATAPGPKSSPATLSGRGARPGIWLGLVAAVVVVFYVLIGNFDQWQTGHTPESAYYNQLVQGFAAGHLHLRTEAPPALLQTPDPYDPAFNGPYQDTIHDLSLYRGKLYLYFGVTPALLVFWPYWAITGKFLAHRDAVILFCTVGYLLSVLLIRRVQRSAFPSADPWLLVAAAAALGLIGMPILLGRADVWEVPISCAYCLTMGCLFALWQALQHVRHRWRWTAVASALYGLVLGSRPSLLFGALVLLLPALDVLRTGGWVEFRRAAPRMILATLGPIVALGAALLVYNWLRFDDPREFGIRYQLASTYIGHTKLFRIAYLAENLRACWVALPEIVPWFPFVYRPETPPLSNGYLGTVGAFGTLVVLPFTSLALVVFATLTTDFRRGMKTRSAFPLFLAGASALFAATTVTMMLYAAAIDRYELEFVYPLVLLAVLGMFILDDRLARWRGWQKLARSTWAILLAVSAGYSLLAAHELSPETEVRSAIDAFKIGDRDAAAAHYEAALYLAPHAIAANYGLGMVNLRGGNPARAAVYLGRAARLAPHSAPCQLGYGEALASIGHWPQARTALEQAIALDPTLAAAHRALGNVLVQLHDPERARAEFTAAAQLDAPNRTK